jgi:tRNA threonylcarbamoyladenosine biosynthesis protein TsaB
MKVLAIDTSTMLGGVALMDDRLGLIVEVRLGVKSTHSERLMTSIEYCLKQSGYKASDMNFFAVAIGPGSFTGLRIGLSTVKGFSYATGKPIVSVPTLEALAENFPFSLHPVCTMLDARKKEVYAALFKWEDDGFIRLIDEMSIRVERFLERMKEVLGKRGQGRFSGEKSKCSNERIIFTGDGALLYKNEIASLMGERVIFASPEKMVPSPANVASIAIKKVLRGEFSEQISLVPFYIRRSEAEMKERKNNY